jgi:hypothetical protein
MILVVEREIGELSIQLRIVRVCHCVEQVEELAAQNLGQIVHGENPNTWDVGGDLQFVGNGTGTVRGKKASSMHAAPAFSSFHAAGGRPQQR